MAVRTLNLKSQLLNGINNYCLSLEMLRYYATESSFKQMYFDVNWAHFLMEDVTFSK